MSDPQSLIKFLVARIAEDEVRFAITAFDEDLAQSADLNEGYIVTLHERLLAECEAKRRVVLRAELAEAARTEVAVGTIDAAAAGRVAAELGRVLEELALPYSDHPDYRPEWRP